MTVYLHQGDLPADVEFAGSIAVDTETMGLNPHRDRLCVVQLSDGNGDAISCASRRATMTPPG